MWRNPVDAQHCAHGKVKTQLFVYLAPHTVGGRLIGLGHPARKIPAGLVPRLDEQDTPGLIADERVGTDPLAGLLGVAFRKVRLPRFGVPLVKRQITAHAKRLHPKRRAAAARPGYAEMGSGAPGKPPLGYSPGTAGANPPNREDAAPP